LFREQTIWEEDMKGQRMAFLWATILSASLFVGPLEMKLATLSAEAPRSLGGGPKQEKIWRHPGAVEKLDFVGGPYGHSRGPKPPFTFVEEDKGGSSPKIEVRDAKNDTFIVKWGPEVHAEVFATRMAWAVGYFVDGTYFVPNGRIGGVTRLDRAKRVVGPDGAFSTACFELRDRSATFLKKNNWTWHNNPFIGTRELNGLKVILMLTSNWDNKDARDQDRGPNTGILEYRVKNRLELRYLVTDWGGSMGKWGKVFTRGKWDCEGYTEQTIDFIKGSRDGRIKWGYTAQHSSDAKEDITISDVRWILQYIGRITDRQIVAGLQASGASSAEVQCFAKAIRQRIQQMQRLVDGASRSEPLSSLKNSYTHEPLPTEASL
jgi:hypothetical protein